MTKLATRSVIGLVLFVVMLAMIVLFVSLAALQGGCGGGGGGGAYESAEVPKGFPAQGVKWVPVLKESERVYKVNWLIMASILSEESGWGGTAQGVRSGVNAYGCCAGAMQFNLSDTWDGHKNAYKKGNRPDTYPLKRGDHPSVYDGFDSVMAAGDKLSKQGASMKVDGPGLAAAFKGYGAGGPSDAKRRQLIAQWSGADTTTMKGGEEDGGGAGNCGSDQEDEFDAGNGKLGKPCDGPLTSPFGPRSSPGGIGSTNHQGQDLGCPTGAPTRAAETGRVTQAGAFGGYGNFICLSHGSLSTCYAHQSRISVRAGQRVDKGEIIGRVGSTGNVTGPHLHFEVRKGGGGFSGQAVDPKPYLS